MKRLLALAVVAPVLLAQNYGAVEGTVSDGRSHTGIAGAAVQLRAVDGRAAGYVGKTDAGGHFLIENVLPGDYSASYSAPDYAGPDFTQGAYRPFHVTSGGTPVSLQVELEPLGKLSARVLDEDGHPVEGVRVLLMRLYGVGASTGVTDAQGQTGMSKILPGTYVLLAQPVQSGTVDGKKADGHSAPPDPPREGERHGRVPTYFPNAVDAGQAEPIRIAAGSDLSGYEIRLRSAPVYRVDGVVLDEQGTPVPKAALKLVSPMGLNGIGDRAVTAGGDGHFEFPSVAAGDWRISAEAKRNGLTLKAVASVTVADRDVGSVTVRLSPPFAVSGTVDLGGSGEAQAVHNVAGGMLQGVGPIPLAPLAQAVEDQNGNFRIDNVYPGRYRIVPAVRLPKSYLDSVWLGGHNVTGQEVDLSASSPPIRLVYRSDAARVRGTVEDGAGTVVYLLPQDESLLNWQFIRSIATDRAGRFEVGGLRPGDYYAFAFDHADFAALMNPAFVRTLAPQAATVHVDAGEIGNVNLRVTAWPE